MNSLLSKKREKTENEEEDPLYDLYLRVNILENIIVGPTGKEGLLKRVEDLCNKMNVEVNEDPKEETNEECKEDNEVVVETPGENDCGNASPKAELKR